MLDDLQDKMGIENKGGNELVDLEMETKPEDVVNGIAHHQQ